LNLHIFFFFVFLLTLKSRERTTRRDKQDHPTKGLPLAVFGPHKFCLMPFARMHIHELSNARCYSFEMEMMMTTTTMSTMSSLRASGTPNFPSPTSFLQYRYEKCLTGLSDVNNNFISVCACVRACFFLSVYHENPQLIFKSNYKKLAYSTFILAVG